MEEEAHQPGVAVEARSREERRREVDSRAMSQLGFHRLLHVCIYCPSATDPEIYNIYSFFIIYLLPFNTCFNIYNTIDENSANYEKKIKIKLEYTKRL